MPTLQDRLADLADQAPISSADPALADRARRYHRRRRTASLVVVGAVLATLGGLGGLTWERAEPTVVASSAQRAAMPDQLYVPSRWLPTTAEEGPLGRLAAVLPTSEGDEQVVAGVSATTGEYRYLSLPDYVVGPVELSPDGRSVAYPLARVTGDGDDRVVVGAGVGVYDTETGAVRRFVPSASRGGGADSLSWADNGTLVWDQYRLRGTPSEPVSVDGPLMRWDLTQDQPQAFPAALRRDRIVSAGSGAVVLAQGSERRVRVLRVDDPTSWRTVRIEGPLDPLGSEVVVDGDLSRLAATRRSPDAGRGPAKTLVTAALPAPRTGSATRVRPTPVPGSGQTEALIGWTGLGEIATTRQRSEGTSVYGPLRVVLVDPGTGESRQVTTLPLEIDFPSFATDLLLADPATRPAPPRPLDPRAVGVLGVGAVLAGAGALIAWRRRVRP